MRNLSLRFPYLIYLSIASILIGVLIAPLFGRVATQSPAQDLAMLQHDLMHGELEVPADGAPEILMTVEKDDMDGWNITLQTLNFTFAPEQVNEANVPNAGHAHLYVNGIKMARVYGPYFHIPDLPPGQHEITVSLSSNDHSFFVKDGSRIEARAVIMQGQSTAPAG
ncbi:hypothetical protein [Shimia ponticola]|uniref:hypothetical protein n=1 Tax=Shimia ponticola TaxID=2582893 RepID=UPI0011BF4BFC|nr:hypothetical protein [Shimia ponticola]